MDTAGDGIREDEAGNTIAFSLVTNTQNSVHEKVGTIIQQGLEEIGIKADFRLIEFRDLVSRLTRSYDWGRPRSSASEPERTRQRRTGKPK